MIDRKMTFHFEGSLADEHEMNFYEVARFQYAASRLLVKLAHFRRTGRIPDRITSKVNAEINVTPYYDGSFNIDVSDPGQSGDDEFMSIGLDDLVAYVGERLVGKIDEETLRSSGIREMPGIAEQTSSSDSAVDRVAEAVVEGVLEMDEVPSDFQGVIKRRIAEIYRDRLLQEENETISKIDELREQKLLGMAAPLVKEMAVALRRSAETLEVTSTSRGSPNPLLYLDEGMARDIEAAKVDKEITALLCDVVQFNKDNGWGKVKYEEGTKTVSFSIPSDLLPRIKQKLIDTMKRDYVYLQTYFVRDRSGEVKRLIVAGVLDTPRE